MGREKKLVEREREGERRRKREREREKKKKKKERSIKKDSILNKNTSVTAIYNQNRI